MIALLTWHYVVKYTQNAYLEINSIRYLTIVQITYYDVRLNKRHRICHLRQFLIGLQLSTGRAEKLMLGYFIVRNMLFTKSAEYSSNVTMRRYRIILHFLYFFLLILRKLNINSIISYSNLKHIYTSYIVFEI